MTHTRGLLHIETPLGLINIRVGLMDSQGRIVESIEVIPDKFAGENKIVRRGCYNTRLIQLKKKENTS